MLGEQSAAAYANHLFAGPWTAPEVEHHQGYARDHFRILLDRDTPPPAIPGNVWRALERSVWWFYRAYVLLLKQRARLDQEDTNFTAAVNVDDAGMLEVENFVTNPEPQGTAP